jgi:hypothetical protein
MEPDFRRIKWFFYSDDRQGNTIRVFDNDNCGLFYAAR